MTQTVPAESAASGFAGLLASLARAQEPTASPWDDGALADDIATISYEQALRTPAPCQPAPVGPRLDAASSQSKQHTPPGTAEFPPRRAMQPLKTASITIRLSEPECAQLRQRAAESGLTISAYLRSCTLEVESLRTQVKQTLAELRQASPAAPALAGRAKPHRASASPGWRRFWPFRAAAQSRP